MERLTDFALKAMRAEYDAIGRLIDECGERYEDVLQLFSRCEGKVIFVGIGKSGHVGKKLAATFSSTGTPSFFVHAAESLHGDLGMIEKRDIAVLISNSGNTQEVLNALSGIKKIGCVTVAFTSGEGSALAKGCDYKLIYPKCAEADHLNLAPTVSSTLTLVLGDALACALSFNRRFARDDFYKYHPAGALGQMLKDEKNKG